MLSNLQNRWVAVLYELYDAVWRIVRNMSMLQCVQCTCARYAFLAGQVRVSAYRRIIVAAHMVCIALCEHISLHLMVTCAELFLVTVELTKEATHV